MRDADVCILNQLLFLNGSRGGFSDTFRKSICFVAYRFCVESLNLSALWPEERFPFLGCRVISFVRWNIQNNHRDTPRDSWLGDCAEDGTDPIQYKHQVQYWCNLFIGYRTDGADPRHRPQFHSVFCAVPWRRRRVAQDCWREWAGRTTATY